MKEQFKACWPVYILMLIMGTLTGTLAGIAAGGALPSSLAVAGASSVLFTSVFLKIDSGKLKQGK